MFLFSKKFIKDSLADGEAPEEKLQLIHWGPEIAFYDHILQVMPDPETRRLYLHRERKPGCKHDAVAFFPVPPNNNWTCTSPPPMEV